MKFSKYKQQMARARMRAAYDVLNALENAWRKAYPVYVGDKGSFDRAAKVFGEMVQPAQEAAYKYDQEYKKVCLGIE